jgi:serine/threonine protein kinase
MVTDFGIAKDLIDEETTQSLISGGTQGSPMYMAPEIRLGGRRGRAVDIFSLGCIFLEISTSLIAGLGARGRFAEHRDVIPCLLALSYPDSSVVLVFIRLLS